MFEIFKFYKTPNKHIRTSLDGASLSVSDFIHGHSMPN